MRIEAVYVTEGGPFSLIKVGFCHYIGNKTNLKPARYTLSVVKKKLLPSSDR